MLNRWSDADAHGLSPLDLLVYVSRIMGEDGALVVWGGGNTSLKQTERDFRGRETRVLRVKGSGSDMKAVQPRDFPGVRMDDVGHGMRHVAPSALGGEGQCVTSARMRRRLVGKRAGWSDGPERVRHVCSDCPQSVPRPWQPRSSPHQRK